MPNLRLHPTAPQQESDSIPFPRQVSRIGTWHPKPLYEAPPQRRGLHDAEAALERVQADLNRLSGFFENDDDRPRAA